MRMGGVLSFALLSALILAPPLHALTNPSNDAAAMSFKIRLQDNFRPDPITDLDAAFTANEGEILLQWTAPDSDSLPTGNGPPVSVYFIRYATFSAASLAGDTTTWWSMASSTHATTTPPQAPPQIESDILTGLEPGATLYFGIKSRDSAGNLSFIDILSETGPQANAQVPDFAPPQVAGLSISASTSSLTVSWSASTAPDVNEYRIYWDTSAPADVFAASVTLPSGTTYFAFNNLVQNNTYFFYVTALDRGLPAFLGDVLESPPSAVVSAYPPASPAPPVVLNLTATAGDMQVTLDWDDSTDPTVAGYFLYRSLSGAGPFARINATALTTSTYVDTGLTNGVTYFYGITTVDGSAVESAIIGIVSATPRKPFSSRPQEPTGVFGTLSSTGVFSIVWTPVTMDVTLSTRVELASYRIYKSSALEGPFFYRDTVNPLLTAWQAPELVPPTVWYLVRAMDTSDNESDDSMRVEATSVPTTYAVSADETARVMFTGNDALAIRATASEQGEDIRIVVDRKSVEEQGTVLNSYEIKSFGAASGSEIKDIKFARPTVALQFRFAKGLRAPYFKPGTAFRYAGSTLRDVGIFWHNRVEFVKFGGKIDDQTGVVSIKTASPLGKYQVRQVLRAGEFSIAQITPRKIFTPNGDGVNDEIIIFLENPNDSVISQARVFDLTGAEVADFEQGIVAGAHGVISLKWNGKDRIGNYVRSGVYVYQIKSEGKTLNGTMVVAR